MAYFLRWTGMSKLLLFEYIDNQFGFNKSEKRFLAFASLFLVATFAVLLVQNIIRYSIHESYNAWKSVTYLSVSLLLFIPLLPFVLKWGRLKLAYKSKLNGLHITLLIASTILLFYILSSIVLHLCGFYDLYFSEQYARYYFGREVLFHVLTVSALIFFIFQTRKDELPKMISGTLGRNEITIKAELVRWIEADDHYLKIYTNENALLKRATLERITEELKPDFIRIHRKYLVNKKQIVGRERKQRDEFVILDSGERLKVGRSYSPLEL